MEQETITCIEQFIDYLLPELTPYESTMYLYLFRNSYLKDGSNNFRVGKRTIAEKFSIDVRGEHTSYAHVTKMLANLEQKGCIRIGDTDRFGTLYTVTLPKDVPGVIEKMMVTEPLVEEDYFTNVDKRLKIFERDNWICQYCGDKVTKLNATLDHFLPQNKGGKHNKDNLRTCCLTCNSIKVGKSYEEAAPLLLKSIQGRKAKAHEG